MTEDMVYAIVLIVLASALISIDVWAPLVDSLGVCK